MTGIVISLYMQLQGKKKRKALAKINDNQVDQYGKAWEYENELLKVMPDSTILVMTKE